MLHVRPARASSGAALVLALLLAPSSARSETPEQAADRLFNEAKALASAGRYAEACPKLEESQKLDPGIGTEFDLADCYERTGHPARAYRLFAEVAKIAHASGKIDRANAATARLAALAEKIASLRIVANNPAPGLVVKLDGAVVPSVDLGAAQPIEAGDHALEASAPGSVSWRHIAHIEPGAKVDVQVPPLAAVAAPPPPAGASGLGGQRILAIGVGTAGLVGVATGAVSGVLSLAWHNSAQSACPGAACPTSNPGFGTWHQAVVAGNVSTIAFAAGGALLAGAAVLWISAPKAGATAAWLRVGPGGLALEGRL
jgi:hypothetical protein